MLSLVAASFVVGLLGSAHCVGMCGGITAALLHGRGRPGGALALYLVGKTAAYAALGAAAGGLGVLAGLAASGVQAVLSLGFGAVLVVVGLGTCGVVRPWDAGKSASFASILARPLGRLMRSERPEALLGVGALNGLLPCGLVYAMLAQAAAVGEPATGALTLAAFGAGTAPALGLVGVFGGRVPVERRLWMQRAAGVLVIGLGLLTATRAATALRAERALDVDRPATHAPLCLPGEPLDLP
jgi:sulfite exporter TauE/SafE